MIVPRERPRVTLTSTKEMIVRDTVAVARLLQGCKGRTLLPEQESVVDGVRDLLAETRRALIANNLSRARSCSRSARQLASALDCH
jgi:hypothetical protein